MSPDPAFLYLTKQHREALAGLTYAILDRKGFVTLSGMAGSGKTTLLSWVLGKLPKNEVISSVVFNPTLTREELLELAMLDFGLTDIPPSKAKRLWMLQDFLLKAKAEGKTSVLAIDEAHKLTPELIEEIRLLGNLESADEKLLQVVLIGQSELDDLLNRPDLTQFKQRISVRLALEPLAEADIAQYLEHRWLVAGGTTPAPFLHSAINRIAQWTKGVPRLINSLADNSLILALADQASSVSEAHVDKAATDLRLGPSRSGQVASTPATNGTISTQRLSTPIAELRPYMMPQFKSFDAYQPRRSFLARWATRLGLA